MPPNLLFLYVQVLNKKQIIVENAIQQCKDEAAIQVTVMIWATSWENLLCHMWTTKAQISLRIHTVWSAPLLFGALIV